jgi:EAL domain-containing protein (putative c-di-GMP-specific phosphodiesterase class I)
VAGVEEEQVMTIDRPRLRDLRLSYQPIVVLRTGDLVGFEALVRLQHPSAGLLLPKDFIPQAEESGFIVAIDGWVLQHGCQQLARWQASGLVAPGFVLSVNLSALSLGRFDLPVRVEQALSKWRLEPRQLQLELTESALIADLDRAGKTLEQLHDMGIGLALDDFGTGYSSLSYLYRFRVDALKLDRLFVEHVDEGGRAGLIVRATVALAQVLGMTLTAEGVETAPQAATLLELGCELAQGYFFSRPIPVDQIECLLRNPLPWPASTE